MGEQREAPRDNLGRILQWGLILTPSCYWIEGPWNLVLCEGWIEGGFVRRLSLIGFPMGIRSHLAFLWRWHWWIGKDRVLLPPWSKWSDNITYLPYFNHLKRSVELCVVGLIYSLRDLGSWVWRITWDQEFKNSLVTWWDHFSKQKK